MHRVEKEKLSIKKLLLLIFAVFLITAGFALPEWRSVEAALSDYSPKSPPSLSPPSKGSSYNDPVFGTKIIRITDASDASIATIAYPHWPAFNSNSTKLIIGLDDNPYLYSFDPNNYTFQKLAPLFNGDPMQWEGMTWSTTDPDTVYGISGYNSNIKLRAYNVTTKQYTFVHDFTAAGELPAGIPHQMSKARANDRFFSFDWRPGDGQPVRYAIVYDKQLNKTYKFDVQASYGVPGYDECRLDRDGNYLYMNNGNFELWVWKFASQSPEQRTFVAKNAAYKPGGHSDSGAGFYINADVWGGGNNNGNRIIKRSLDNPTSWGEMFDSGASGDWQSDHHISLIGPNDTWALVTTMAASPNYSLPFTNEIFLVKTDGSGQVKRLLHHRSSNADYWNTPRANLSPDGRFAAYASDMGGGHVDTYVAV
ncbi:MAG: hypothetical protein AB1489_40855, partial [Acidobacteriota bacterium]